MDTYRDVVVWIDGNMATQRRVIARRRMIRRNVITVLAMAATVIVLLAVFAFTASSEANTTPTTTATTLHGLPGNNPGHSNQQVGAAPAGTAANADGGMHNIAGVRANGGRDDEPPACDAHGGLGTVNRNCVDG